MLKLPPCLKTSIENDDWAKSLEVFKEECLENLSHSQAHLQEFVNLWCRRCAELLEQKRLKVLIEIFIKIYTIENRNQDVEKLINKIYFKYDFTAILNLSDPKTKLLLRTSYAHHKFLIGDYVTCDTIALSSILDAQKLIGNIETEDHGWSVVRRNLSFCKNKYLARKNLCEVISTMEVKS